MKSYFSSRQYLQATAAQRRNVAPHLPRGRWLNLHTYGTSSYAPACTGLWLRGIYHGEEQVATEFIRVQ